MNTRQTRCLWAATMTMLLAIAGALVALLQVLP